MGRLEAADRAARRDDRNWSATICSSPTPSGSQRGIDEGIANSILIKVNQIGTLTETIEAIELAHRNGYTSISSHRSGETEDATIADLAVAMAPARSRPARCRAPTASAKYNQLLRIEETLGDAAVYGGPLFKRR